MSQVHAEFPLESGTAADRARDETLDRQWWAAGPRRAAATAATARDSTPAAVRLPSRTPARAPVTTSAPDADAPSGWYPEPPRLRYWDGERWTEDTRFARPPVASTRVGISVLVSPPPPAAPVAAAAVSVAAAAVPALAAPVLEAPIVAPPIVAPPIVEPPIVAPPIVEPPAAAEDGLVAAPVPTAQAEHQDMAPEPEDRGIMHELAVLLLVAMVALTVGAIVAALGIALTS